MPWYNKKMNKRIERILLFITIDIAKNTKYNDSENTDSKNTSNKIYDLEIKMVKDMVSTLNYQLINIINIKHTGNNINEKIQLLEKNNLLLSNLLEISNKYFLIKDYLIIYLIRNILLELNKTFIFLLKTKISGTLETINKEYYFKEDKNFTHFKDSSNDDLLH
jgi:hypothetical protein